MRNPRHCWISNFLLFIITKFCSISYVHEKSLVIAGISNFSHFVIAKSTTYLMYTRNNSTVRFKIYSFIINEIY